MTICSFSSSLLKLVSKNMKGRSKSSHEWLTRQLKDPYVENARMKNYRCRSAFKLIEINAKYNIFQPGQSVLDCGAAPGSWTQVAVDKTNADFKDMKSPKGFVVAIDKLPIHPIEGAVILGNHDFTNSSSQDKIRDILKDRKVDIVLSDMAPNATGVKSLDHDSIVALAYMFVRFGLKVNSIGGTLLLKLWEGNMTLKLENDLRRFYSNVKRVKPPASRSDSSEIFILSRDFQGIKSN